MRICDVITGDGRLVADLPIGMELYVVHGNEVHPVEFTGCVCDSSQNPNITTADGRSREARRCYTSRAAALQVLIEVTQAECAKKVDELRAELAKCRHGGVHPLGGAPTK